MEHSYKIPIFIISAMEMIFLALFTFFMSGHIEKGLLFVILGIALMIVAIPFHIFAKHCKILYIFSILWNTAGSALFCAMYYTATECKITLKEFFVSLIPAGMILLLALILLFISPKLVAIMLAVNFVLSIVDIVQWIRYPADCIYSFGFFASVITFMCLCAMVALSFSDESGNTLRYASFAGFGIFLVIAFVVLLILSEGEILDGAIPDFSLPGKKNAKTK